MAPNPPRPLVVFDWNGTVLADTVASWRAANICLEWHGAPPITLARYRATAAFPIIHFYARNGVPVDKVLAAKEKGNKVFQDAYERLAARARTRQGARALLTWLRARGVPAIVLSNYVTHRIQTQLERLGLAPYFAHVDAHDGDGGQIVEFTSKHERLSAFMCKRNYRPQDAVIIGDSTEEPAVARALGLTSVAVRGGSFSDAQLAHARPDHTVGSLAAARPVLERWLAQV
jgi:phosphoglycolate phosphatase